MATTTRNKEQSPIVQHKKLTNLREIEDSGEFGSVWVLNNTKGKNRSQVVFSVPNSTGSDLDVVYVPSTFIPINLTGQVSKKQLLNSSSFRKSVTQSTIILIEEHYAESLLKEDGVLEEQARLANENATHSDFAFAAGVVPGMNKDVAMVAGMEETEESRVLPVVQTTINALCGGEMDETEALTKLRSLGDLERHEYKYISQKTEEYPRIQRWLKQVKMRLEGTIVGN